MRPPCKKGCEQRSGTCHAECERYLEYVEYCRKRREKRHAESIANDYTAKQIKKSRERRER